MGSPWWCSTADDDLRTLVRDAVAGGADALGMAGGDGSLALVAAAAAASSLAFVPVPAGTRNHFARDARNRPARRRRGPWRVRRRGGAHHRHRRGKRPQLSQQRVAGPLRRGRSAAGVPRRQGPDSCSRPPARWPARARRLRPSGSQTTRDANSRTGRSCWCRTIPTRCGLPSGEARDRRSTAACLGIAVLYPRGRSRVLAAVTWTAPLLRIDGDGAIGVGIDGEAEQLTPPLLFTIRPRALRLRAGVANRRTV